MDYSGVSQVQYPFLIFWKLDTSFREEKENLVPFSENWPFKKPQYIKEFSSAELLEEQSDRLTGQENFFS